MCPKNVDSFHCFLLFYVFQIRVWYILTNISEFLILAALPTVFNVKRICLYLVQLLTMRNSLFYAYLVSPLVRHQK